MALNVRQLCGLHLLVLSVWTYTGTYAYHPVIVLHGIFADSASMDDLITLVTDAHPGTTVYDIDGYDDADSMEKMWTQVAGFKKKMLPIMQNATDGINLICFSQGGLACRAILETTPNHNVKTFVSLSSPQGGQYGDTMYLKYLFPNFTKEHIYTFFYTMLGQELSIGNYWRDPHHMADYIKSNKFLPVIDFPTDSSYKKNFESIEDLVLIGGPDDGVITPWQSSHFGFCDDKDNIVELEMQDYYLNDTFGLKTLNSQGKLHVHEIPGVQHIHWHGNKDVFTCCIEPYLK